jgi:C-8 sterol isomerase
MPPRKASPPPRTWTSTLTVLAVAVALLSAVFYFLDAHLDWFYIFNPQDLHELAQRAISAHGNDTRAVVELIVAELSEKLPGGYVNLDEEWIFNNAGGAMGAMYIIHASEFLLVPCSCVTSRSSCGCDEHVIVTGCTCTYEHLTELCIQASPSI